MVSAAAETGSQPTCLQDLDDETWWVPCGFGDRCIQNNQVLGKDGLFASFGDYQRLGREILLTAVG